MLTGSKPTKIVNSQFLAAGYCKHFEAIALSGGRWRSIKFPAIFNLITHSDYGYFLFDTGYTNRFADATKKFPDNLYRLATPVTISSEQSAEQQLLKLGIQPKEIKGIIISHFHADHIAGLLDFPQAKLYCSQAAYKIATESNRFKRIKNGVLNLLLPKDFSSRVIFSESLSIRNLDSSMAPFTYGYDLLNDGSLIIMELSGHACGQIGLLYINNNYQKQFLVADACWSTHAFKHFIPPNFIAKFITANYKDYIKNLHNLHLLNKNNSEVLIAPSHCSEIYHQYVQ
ncbi:MAG: MBL fold metallo-hydrolase [Gammaproteobacteria bacterium]|nr:MBL fold metallo-hydrolase [Gammaproteobacteria bacterium]